MQITEQISSKKSKGRSHALRIDMTPMVDLGFLLITFFVFTARLSDPKVLNLNMPKDQGDPMPTKCSTSFTVVAGSGSIGWYHCEDGNTAGFQKSNGTNTGSIRSALLARKKNVAMFGKATDMVVLIKPLEDCDYQTLIALLDEMTINEITRYAIVEPEPDDIALMQLQR